MGLTVKSAVMQIILTVVSGPHSGQTFAFDQHDHFFVGRSKSAQFRLPEKDPYFSRMHFMVEMNPPACRLLDLGSRNGTHVNGKIVQTVDLTHGDVIQGGNTEIRVTLQDGQNDDAPETLAQPSTVKEFGLPSSESQPDSIDTVDWRPPGYEIGAILGKGGMGIVYQAKRKSDGADVAIKMIRPAVAGSEADYLRFRREIEILRQLNHAAIVLFLDAGDVSGLLFFVMEFVNGADAKVWVERRPKPLAVPVAVKIISRVLDALEHAHQRGFVHRDVKPSNILICQDGKKLDVKLTDFGLARAYQDSKLSGLTLTGGICGTPRYMAPEQITDARRVQPASDQYSAAATLYWLLTQKNTHDFDDRMHVGLQQILTQEPVPIRSRRPDVPENLAAAILQALSKDPAARFDSAAAFRDALRKSLT